MLLHDQFVSDTLDVESKVQMFIKIFSGYDMSPFIRRYAKYLSEKSGAYRGTAMDFCKVKRGSVGTELVIAQYDSDIVIQEGWRCTQDHGRRQAT